MKKHSIVCIISNVNKIFSLEWLAEGLDKKRFDLKFILLNPAESHIESYLKRQNIPVERITFRGKKDLVRATFIAYLLFKKWNPDIVHAHLFEATLVGLTAAWLAGVKKRFYTRHHPDLHHVYFPKAVKYDKYCNWLATDIITPSKTTKEILSGLEKVPSEKIHLVHSHYKLDTFDNVAQERIDGLRRKYGIGDAYPIIGVISRYTTWKGIQYTIPAFKRLLREYPNSHIILANAAGDYQNQIKELLATLPRGSFTEITFEMDSPALYKLFDIFIHVPIAKRIENAASVYVEALASSAPSVFTLSGVANEFIKDRWNALVVDYKNSDEIYEAILAVLSDKNLAEKLVRNGKESVQQFSLCKVIPELERLYEQ